MQRQFEVAFQPPGRLCACVDCEILVMVFIFNNSPGVGCRIAMGQRLVPCQGTRHIKVQTVEYSTTLHSAIVRSYRA